MIGTKMTQLLYKSVLTRVRSITWSIGKGIGSRLDPSRVVVKEVWSCIYCRYVWAATEYGECIGPKQAQIITMHAQLGLPDKDRVIKGLGVCYVAWWGFMKELGFRANPLVWLDSYRALVPQPHTTYMYII